MPLIPFLNSVRLFPSPRATSGSFFPNNSSAIIPTNSISAGPRLPKNAMGYIPELLTSISKTSQFNGQLALWRITQTRSSRLQRTRRHFKSGAGGFAFVRRRRSYDIVFNTAHPSLELCQTFPHAAGNFRQLLAEQQ